MLTYFSASTAGKTFTPAFCMAWKGFISKPIKKKKYKLAILIHFWATALRVTNYCEVIIMQRTL